MPSEHDCRRDGHCWHEAGFEPPSKSSKLIYRVLRCCYDKDHKWVAPSVPYLPDSTKEHGPYIPKSSTARN